ncbi:MAG: hypothetical protein ACI8P9_001356 [Parasphingorhabdus sp.]|jgi:hypothetical protein
MKNLKILLLTALIFASAPGFANNPLEQAVANPVSLFDFFLYQFRQETKCKRLLADGLEPPILCLSNQIFDVKSNRLKLYFEEQSSSENLKGFAEFNDFEKEELLLRRIDRLANRIGVVNEWGLFYSIPVTIKNDASNIDADEFRKALAAITELHLNIALDGKIYNITRLADGSTSFEIR